MAGHLDSQTFPSVLIDDRQQPESASAGLDEVVSPDVVRTAGAQTNARSVATGVHASVFPASTPPASDALHSLMVDPPAGSPQQGRDPTIAIATKPTGQGDDGPRQGILVGSSDASMALGGPGLAEHSTSPAFRDTQRLTDAPPTDAPGLAVSPCDLPSACPRSQPPSSSECSPADLQPLGLIHL